MTRGTKVKFTEQGVKWATPKKVNKRSNDVQWEGRLGSIIRICRNPSLCVVRWDGNEVPGDAIPVRFLEVA